MNMENLRKQDPEIVKALGLELAASTRQYRA